MANRIRFILPFIFLATALTVSAQKPKPVPAKPPVFEKFAPPKLTSRLGLHADSASVYLEEAVQLVRLPLKITDDKKNEYHISSYSLMYKRRAVTEDEQTGKVTPVISNVSDLFRETPLPAIWIRNLTEQMKPGEELHFFDIVVRDNQGRLMYAPELKITIRK